jgi:hypothetical protein
VPHSSHDVAVLLVLLFQYLLVLPLQFIDYMSIA